VPGNARDHSTTGSSRLASGARSLRLAPRRWGGSRPGFPVDVAALAQHQAIPSKVLGCVIAPAGAARQHSPPSEALPWRGPSSQRRGWRRVAQQVDFDPLTQGLVVAQEVELGQHRLPDHAEGARTTGLIGSERSRHLGRSPCQLSRPRACLKTDQARQLPHYQMDHRDAGHGFARLGHILVIHRTISASSQASRRCAR
jgi:hypothetical protein